MTAAITAVMAGSVVGPCLPDGLSLSTTASALSYLELVLRREGYMRKNLNGTDTALLGSTGSNYWRGSNRDFFFDGEEWEARWVGVAGSYSSITQTTGYPTEGTWRLISPSSNHFVINLTSSSPGTLSAGIRLEIRDPTSLIVVAKAAITLAVTVT